MEWVSNCRSNQKPEEGTIFSLKNNPLRISIHRFVGCGEEWFLSCPEFNITQVSLSTNDFDKAVEKAKLAIETVATLNYLNAKSFFESTEENIIVKY